MLPIGALSDSAAVVFFVVVVQILEGKMVDAEKKVEATSTAKATELESMHMAHAKTLMQIEAERDTILKVKIDLDR